MSLSHKPGSWCAAGRFLVGFQRDACIADPLADPLEKQPRPADWVDWAVLVTLVQTRHAWPGFETLADLWFTLGFRP